MCGCKMDWGEGVLGRREKDCCVGWGGVVCLGNG